MKNDGKRNEYLFIYKLNNKRVSELDYLLRDMIESIFDDINPSDIIKCFKLFEYEKPDICIVVKNQKKYISIKKGIRNSVHGEKIDKFIRYLKKINVNEEVINCILKYHYADGTIDGSGRIRQSLQDYKKEHYDEIKFINDSINKRDIVESIINRFLIQGTQTHTNKVDILVYGTPNDFFYILKEDIYNFMLSKLNYQSSAVHFSCLTFQPMSRVLDYDESKQERRQAIQIKWYNLEDNIIEIMNQKLLNNLGDTN